MPNYDFQKDFVIAKETEEEIARKLTSHYGIKILWMCPTKSFDLKVLNVRGEMHWIEIKEDFTCQKTGNVGLEFSCRGKPSGILSTRADYYIYKIHLISEGKKFFDYRLISVENLKTMIQDNVYFRIINGGDSGSDSLNYLFKIGDFYKWSTPLFN